MRGGRRERLFGDHGGTSEDYGGAHEAVIVPEKKRFMPETALRKRHRFPQRWHSCHGVWHNAVSLVRNRVVAIVDVSQASDTHVGSVGAFSWFSHDACGSAVRHRII